jgi:AraC-like DNA-binding protein
VGFALRRFVAQPHVTTIGGVTDQIGLSPKRFIQLFRDQTGFTPKVFCRIRRFQRALESIESRGNVEWAQVALDCGYFDQAHFIHDFRAFSGINPSSYLAHRTRHRNHVPLIG